MTTEIVVFPDVEQLLCDYLTATLPAHWTVPGGGVLKVGTRVPNPRPAEFVRLFVTGGAQRDLAVDTPRVTVDAYAERESRAHDLAAICRGLIHAIDTVDGVQFYRIESGSRPQNLPDPTTGQTRYTATYSLDYRGAAAV